MSMPTETMETMTTKPAAGKGAAAKPGKREESGACAAERELALEMTRRATGRPPTARSTRPSAWAWRERGRARHLGPAGRGGREALAVGPRRACLCSMVLRPVERLVFSPKER